jgi:MoaA/NifB/PqqE/SkfB family radical SAM enzyme
VLDDAAQFGIRGLTITGGGEPLMHPQVLDIVRLIRRYPFSAGIITNAGRMQAELADELVATFNWIRVSFRLREDSSYEW